MQGKLQAVSRIPPYRRGDCILLLSQELPERQLDLVNVVQEVKSLTCAICGPRPDAGYAVWMIHLQEGRAVPAAAVDRLATAEEVKVGRRIVVGKTKPVSLQSKLNEGRSEPFGHRPIPVSAQGRPRYVHNSKDRCTDCGVGKGGFHSRKCTATNQ